MVFGLLCTSWTATARARRAIRSHPPCAASPSTAAAGKGTAFSHQAEFGTERAGGGAEPTADDGDAGASNNAEEGDKPAAVERKDEATLQREREEELAALEQRIADAKAKSANAATAAKDNMGRMRQLTAAITAARAKSEGLQTAYKLKKKTLEMLPEAAKHIAQLQQICGTSAGKLLSLAAEWEQHRRPIIEAIRQHKESRSLRKVSNDGSSALVASSPVSTVCGPVTDTHHACLLPRRERAC